MKPKHFSLGTLLLLISLTVIAGNQSGQIKLTWEVGYSKESAIEPSRWIPATVPGAVQLDIARAEKYKPLYYAENWKDYLWMEDQFYYYRTSFDRPDLPESYRLHFVSLGIDYEFEIIFNKEVIFHQEGMFTPVDIDLTDRIKDKNQLFVKVYPVPKLHASPADRTQASQVTKPAVSYGWDWHPRVIPLGIWDSTYLEIHPLAHIDDVRIGYNLNADLSEADMDLEFTGANLKGMQYSWTLNDAKGREVLRSEGRLEEDKFSKAFVLSKPEFWWPHDQGVPYLYTSYFKLTDQSGKVLQSSLLKDRIQKSQAGNE